jgi:hypothetical protein
LRLRRRLAALHGDHGKRAADPLADLAADDDGKAAGVVAAHLEAEPAARHAHHGVKGAKEHLERLAGHEPVRVGHAVDLGEELPRHTERCRDRRQRLAHLHDVRRLQQVLLRVDHAAGELVENVLETLALLGAERRVVVPR